MAKSISEVFQEIKDSVAVSKSGKPLRYYSRSDFDKLAKAYFNTPDYEIEAVSMKDGKPEKKKLKPVKEFRTFIRKVLIDFGVDKQEADRVIDNYEFRSVEGVYELCSELVSMFASAKKFDFIKKDDFTGSIYIKDVEPTVTTHRDLQTKKPFKVSKKAHKVLVKKSSTPSWLKKRVK